MLVVEKMILQFKLQIRTLLKGSGGRTSRKVGDNIQGEDFVHEIYLEMVVLRALRVHDHVVRTFTVCTSNK